MAERDAEPIMKLRSGDVVWREFNEEAIALDLRSSKYLSTNVAGIVLWRRLERGATKGELVDALLSEFDVSPERAAGDVEVFLRECQQRGLLEEDAQSRES